MAGDGSFERFAKPMSGGEFARLSGFIHDHCGIKMPPVKKVMLEARLQKRLRSLGISSFGEYCDYLFASAEGEQEIVRMINAVTTNKTDFFREPVHFQYLTDAVLPDFFAAEGAERAFTVWSAGCSSGEEPYTLAMVLSEFRDLHPRFRFSILATDLSTRVIEKAKLGIYQDDRTEAVRPDLKRKYFLRGKDRRRGLVRIVPELRELVRFQQANLMAEHPAAADALDALFCRNVIIYFERGVQERLLQRLCRSLKPGGHLFLGHSETVHGFDLPLERMMSTVYRKTA
jgi:chemotaxis protein methyltransferase CheR